MSASALTAMSAMALFAQAGAVSPMPSDDIGQQCGLENPVVIDASDISKTSAILDRAREAKGQSILLLRAELPEQDMTQLTRYLANGCVVDAKLNGTNWSGAVMRGVTFVNSDLSQANLSQADLAGAAFLGTSLKAADLSGADLSYGRFEGGNWIADVSDADFYDADLTGFRFRCSIMMADACGSGGADFTRANLTRADFAEFPAWGQDNFSSAVIDETRLHPRALIHYVGLEFAGDVVLSAQGDSSEFTPPEASLTPSEAARLTTAAMQIVSDDTASFDCTTASTRIEQMICGEYETKLRQLDRTVARVWAQARGAGKGSVIRQLAWLRSRDRCDDGVCLAQSYRQRIAALNGLLGNRLVIAPDQSITYHADVLPLPDGMRGGEVYARLVPVLEDASRQMITLTGMVDGAISAEGYAVGANAHVCGLEIYDARFDPKTGWYSAEGENGEKVQLFMVLGRNFYLRTVGGANKDAIGPWGFVNCGMRANFTDAIDLTPLP